MPIHDEYVAKDIASILFETEGNGETRGRDIQYLNLTHILENDDLFERMKEYSYSQVHKYFLFKLDPR
jgi:hypothetical protein